MCITLTSGFPIMPIMCQAHYRPSVKLYLPEPITSARQVLSQEKYQPAQGLQVHFGAGPILCAPRRASGLCAPCRRRGPGAQCSPLTAAVGVDPGGRGGGGKALPPPTSTLAFFPSEREVPSFCGVSRLYGTMPSRVAGLRRTGRGLSFKGGAQLALKSWHFAAAVLSTGVVHPESSSGARCFVCRAYVICVASTGFWLLFYEGV